MLVRQFYKFNNKNNGRLFSNMVSTIDAKEIEQFQRVVSGWWDQFGPMKPLHAMNVLRIPFITDGLINEGVIKTENVNTPQPLKDINILDVGCGGGVLSEPLARLGGVVTGVDANSDLIETAKFHSKKYGLNINYEATSIESHATENFEKYDVVVASEIIEHVTYKDEFLKACLQCLKPSGTIFITTMSKTIWADIFGIKLAENVFNIIDKGTHELEKFILPEDLQKMLENNNCRTKLIRGMLYNPFTNKWFWCKNIPISYGLQAVKL